MAATQSTDLTKTIKRLAIIKSLIALEEADEINTHIEKLEQQVLEIEVEDIIV